MHRYQNLLKIWLVAFTLLSAGHCSTEVDFSSQADPHVLGSHVIYESFNTKLGSIAQAVLRMQVKILAPDDVTNTYQSLFESGAEGTGYAVAYRQDGHFELSICNDIDHSTSHTLPQGWRGDGITRPVIMTVDRGARTRRWRLFLADLELSRNIDNVGGWIGGNPGSNGVGEAFSSQVGNGICGTLTRDNNEEVNATTIDIDGAYGLKAWANKVYNPGNTPPATEGSHASRLEDALGLTYVRFQPDVSPYTSMANDRFLRVWATGGEDVWNGALIVKNNWATFHLVARFAMKNTGGRELLWKMGSDNYGLAMTYQAGNVLSAYICVGSRQRRLNYQLPASKVAAALNGSDWMDITVSVIGKSGAGRGRRLAMIVDNRVFVTENPYTLANNDFVDDGEWWFGNTGMRPSQLVSDKVCGLNSRNTLVSAEVAVPYGIRMWRGRGCDGRTNCLVPPPTAGVTCPQGEIVFNGKCACPTGQKRDNTGTCVAPTGNPCDDPERNICDANANCFPHHRGMSCTCKTGYRGNGFQCEPATGPMTSCFSCDQTDLLAPDHSASSMDDVCGGSDQQPMGSCQESLMLGHAAGYCASVGLRACTNAEFRALEAQGTGCGFDGTEVASGDFCDDGKGMMTYEFNPDRKSYCRSLAKADVSRADVRCCADKTASTVGMCPAKSCGGCWYHNAGNKMRFHDQANVCGLSELLIDGTTDCRGESKTLQETADTCAKGGARLCTLDELSRGRVQASGCGYDDDLIWSSTPCNADGSKYWLSYGRVDSTEFRDRQPLCMEPSTTSVEIDSTTYTTAVRCCSDEVPDDRCLFDRCELEPCQNGGKCRSYGTMFECECPFGFSGERCEINDLCNATNNPCDVTSTTCATYSYGALCECKPGFAPMTGSMTACADIDECAIDNGGCLANSECINQPGSYKCQCETGYELNATNPLQCLDINECDNDPCGNATCTNTIGDYTCNCNADYVKEPNSKDRCIAINACNSDPCTNADCARGPGDVGFDCSCRSGFEPDTATVCRDINECDPSSPCPFSTDTCENTLGSYVCIADTTVPELTCENHSYVLPINASSVTVAVNGFFPTATDPKDGNLNAEIECVDSDGVLDRDSSIVLASSRQVSCSVQDARGNQDTCTFTVTPEDQQPPILNGCDALSVETVTGSADVPAPSVDANDNVDGVVVATCSPSTAQTYDVNTINDVSCMATDAAGNVGRCTYQVTIIDVSGPVLTCPSNIRQSTDANASKATIVDIGTASAEAPSGSTASPVTCSHTGSSFDVGVTTILCEATANGRKGECSYTITVVDAEAPRMTCPSQLEYFADQGSDRTMAVLTGINAVDNVDVADELMITCRTRSTPAIQFDALYEAELTVGDYNVVCSATDRSSNVGECSIAVSVIDNQPPGIACPNSVSVDSGPASEVVANWTVTTTDNVPSALVATECSPASGSTFSLAASPHTVTCVATDESANTANCSFAVSVEDTGVPLIDCPDTQSKHLGTGQTSTTMPAFTPLVTASDNSGLTPTVSCDPADGHVYDLGRSPVTCTAEDAAGLTSECAFLVEVTNPDGPVLACPETVLVPLPADSQSAAPANDLQLASAVTPIENNSLTCNATGTPVFSAGITVVECTARAANGGGTGSCTYTVVVRDIDPPMFTECPSSRDVATLPGSSKGVLQWPADSLEASDAHDGDNVTVNCSVTSGVTQAEIGTHTVQCVATDQTGNVNTGCDFVVRVVDEEQPDLTCQDTVVRLPEQATELRLVTQPVVATDNSQSVIIPVCSRPLTEPFQAGVSSISCNATDPADNMASCTFSVTVQVDCVPVFGEYGECSPCPNSVQTRELIGQTRPAQFGGEACPTTDVRACNADCAVVATALILDQADKRVLNTTDGTNALRAGLADFYAEQGYDVNNDSIIIDSDDIMVLNEANRRRTMPTQQVRVPYNVSMSSDKIDELKLSVDAVVDNPALAESLLQKLLTSLPAGALDVNATLSHLPSGWTVYTTIPPTTNPTEDSEASSGSVDATAPLIGGVAGGLVLLLVIAMFLMRRSNRSKPDDPVSRESTSTYSSLHGHKTGRRSSAQVAALPKADGHRSSMLSSDENAAFDDDLDMNIFSNPTYQHGPAPYDNEGVDDDDVGHYEETPAPVKTVYSAYDMPEDEQDAGHGYLDVDDEQE
eukprot:TRINITY_DN11764_c0_g1_i4.p1 TRINITY_DN11764_c0_g1~~TRINITY_DN11764_c0_g1_i4.p1  ORF type:complete len:2164 (+),score=402.21 TRINITY_DN11764_c0_g1_i4:76-6567(+)